jgi:hypothetical protein
MMKENKDGRKCKNSATLFTKEVSVFSSSIKELGFHHFSVSHEIPRLE